jgi:hypothetical protein
MCDKVIHFFTTSLYADFVNFVLISIRNQYSGVPRSFIAFKSVSFTDLAKTLKNLKADFRNAKSCNLSFSGKTLTSFYFNGSGGVSVTSLASALK